MICSQAAGEARQDAGQDPLELAALPGRSGSAASCPVDAYAGVYALLLAWPWMLVAQ